MKSWISKGKFDLKCRSQMYQYNTRQALEFVQAEVNIAQLNVIIKRHFAFGSARLQRTRILSFGPGYLDA